MPWININSQNKTSYNTSVTHPLQSYEWGEFRERTGIKVVRRGFEKNGNITKGFQVTIHKIPHMPFCIGYLPKSDMPSKEILEELKKIGKEKNCVFFQLEPNTKDAPENKRIMTQLGLIPAHHPLFTKNTLILDLTKSEEEILKNMHSKTRYNIRVAQKHNVHVAEDNSDAAMNRYIELTNETTKRQGFFAHTETYHRLMWETLRSHASLISSQSNKSALTAHLLTAAYQNKILTTWIVFVFQDTLYYPYGASSIESRETMASTLMMWETIRWGKNLGLKQFDMWGALGKDPDPKDPWFGFHRFKVGFGPEFVEFIGSYDLVINRPLYQVYKIADTLRWMLLRLKK